MVEIITVGLTMVFLIFAILFVLFNLMGSIFSRTKTVIESAGPTVRIVEEDEGEVIAAITAALAHVLGERFKMEKVKKVEEDRFVVWRKTGWRGVRRWRGSSKWS